MSEEFGQPPVQLELLPAEGPPKILWRDETFIGFDTETSGRFPLVAEVVELAAVKWRAGKIIDKFETFVRPSQPMGDAVIAIHHITNDMVANAPLIQDVLPKFYDFINDGSHLIAHNAPFDLGFLALEFEKYNLPMPTNKTVCSCLLSLKTHPKLINHRLATLVQHFNIKVESRHRALDDSKACLEAALRCMETLGADASMGLVFATQGGPLEWARYSMKDLESHPVYGPLVEASRKQLVIEIVYSGGSKPGEPRRITPMGIVRNPKGDYLVGLAHAENHDKRYYLNRILSAKILD